MNKTTNILTLQKTYTNIREESMVGLSTITNKFIHKKHLREPYPAFCKLNIMHVRFGQILTLNFLSPGESNLRPNECRLCKYKTETLIHMSAVERRQWLKKFFILHNIHTCRRAVIFCLKCEHPQQVPWFIKYITGTHGS